MSLGEFEWIDKIRDRLGSPANPYGIGDDAAVWDLPPEDSLVICTDTLVQGAHFDESWPVDAIGFKALAVNLSDLAAMGAMPKAYMLSLTAPTLKLDWVEQYLAGIEKIQKAFELDCIGGDTTRGPLSMTVTALGTVPRGRAIERRGAKPGDRICVTGPLGFARWALEEGAPSFSRDKLFYPKPRITEGLRLREIASAMVDVSDGLLADLGHMFKGSDLGAVLRVNDIPGFQTIADRLGETVAQAYVLSGGEDFELCFTVSRDKFPLSPSIGATVIGEVTESKEVLCLDKAGQTVTPDLKGFQHF